MALTAGVDEAGRGPWAGPVVASAVILPDEHGIDGLRDSKKLSPKMREDLFDKIMAQAVSVGTGVVDQKVIDSQNILKATYKAMQMALGSCRPRPDSALIDGSGLPNQIIPNKGIIKGDNKIDCIKAASIIAKVTRDRIMSQMGIIFPEYGFAEHKGYGTSDHRDALEKYKATPIHRLSYNPVKFHYPNLLWYQNNNRIGWLGERLAAFHLFKQGHSISAMNQTCSVYGEIDIISRVENELIFTEVKTASREHYTSPEGKIDKMKSSRIENSINYYIQKEKWHGDFRVDVITVYLRSGKPVINHLKGIPLY